MGAVTKRVHNYLDNLLGAKTKGRVLPNADNESLPRCRNVRTTSKSFDADSWNSEPTAGRAPSLLWVLGEIILTHPAA